MNYRGLLGALCLSLGAPPAYGAGRAPYGGSLRLPVKAHAKIALNDPHVATTASQRMVARLVHCRLFAVSRHGQIAPELASKVSRTDGEWRIELVRGARFHDGTEVTSQDVVASLERARDMGRRSRAGMVQAVQRMRADGTHRVRVELPPGVRAGAFQRILARPELSILARGKPGPKAGCGAFRTQRVGRTEVVLTAFNGHPLGRPRLDRVTLRLETAGTTAVERFVFDRVDMSFEPSYRFPKSTSQVALGQRSTLFLSVHPGWAAGRNIGVRRALWGVATAKSLARYVPWEVATARSPWPAELSPTGFKVPSVKRLPRLDDVGTIVIAYPKGDRTLGDVANVVRDRFSAISAGGARVRAVPGLQLASIARSRSALANAPLAQDPPWHVGIAIHDWAALDRNQAAWEASEVLGALGLSPQEALLGHHTEWATNVVREARLVPLVHLRRSVYHRGRFHFVSGTGMVRFEDSYKRP